MVVKEDGIYFFEEQIYRHIRDEDFEAEGISINGKDQEVIWVERHNNGQMWSKGKYVNGRQAGLWTYWDSNGRIWKMGEYQNGHLNGLWISWYPNGQMTGEGRMWKMGEYQNG